MKPSTYTFRKKVFRSEPLHDITIHTRMPDLQVDLERPFVLLQKFNSLKAHLFLDLINKLQVINIVCVAYSSFSII